MPNFGSIRFAEVPVDLIVARPVWGTDDGLQLEEWPIEIKWHALVFDFPETCIVGTARRDELIGDTAISELEYSDRNGVIFELDWLSDALVDEGHDNICSRFEGRCAHRGSRHFHPCAATIISAVGFGSIYTTTIRATATATIGIVIGVTTITATVSTTYRIDSRVIGDIRDDGITIDFDCLIVRDTCVYIDACTCIDTCIDDCVGAVVSLVNAWVIGIDCAIDCAIVCVIACIYAYVSVGHIRTGCAAPVNCHFCPLHAYNTITATVIIAISTIDHCPTIVAITIHNAADVWWIASICISTVIPYIHSYANTCVGCCNSCNVTGCVVYTTISTAVGIGGTTHYCAVRCVSTCIHCHIVDVDVAVGKSCSVCVSCVRCAWI